MNTNGTDVSRPWFEGPKPWFARTGGALPGGTFWKLNGYYDPKPALQALKCPVLVIGGELDNYSDTNSNMELFKAVFTESGNNRITYYVFPNANHGYLETQTGKFDENELPQLKRFVPGYFETLTGWVTAVVAEK